MVWGVSMANNCGELVQLGLVLLFICLLVLSPTVQKEDDEGPDDDNGGHPRAERSPVELQQGVGVPGLIDNAISVRLPLVSVLGSGRAGF